MTLGSGRVLDGSTRALGRERVDRDARVRGGEAARTKLTVRSSGAIPTSSSVAAPSAPSVRVMLSNGDTDTTVGAGGAGGGGFFASVVDELARAFGRYWQPVGEPASCWPPNHAGCAAASDGRGVNAVCTPPGGLAKTIRAPPPPPPSKPPEKRRCAHAGCLIALTA